jgi:membrane protease YdiL (CAAX protease family)
MPVAKAWPFAVWRAPRPVHMLSRFGFLWEWIARAPEPANLRPRPFRFFFWVLLLSLPFYAAGVFWPFDGLPFGLPAIASMIVLPAAVATVRTYREQGRGAAFGLWRRVADAGRIESASWFLIAVLWMPVAAVLAYALMRFLHMPLPAAAELPLALAPVIFAAFFVGAVLEEIGWTAYATGPLQCEFGVWGAGFIIGAVWAGWHVLPWWLVQGHPLWWVAGQAALTVELRLLMGWVYANGGRSLFLAVLIHATGNTAYALFPNGGSHYNPAMIAASGLVIAGAAAFMYPVLRRKPR